MSDEDDDVVVVFICVIGSAHNDLHSNFLFSPPFSPSHFTCFSPLPLTVDLAGSERAAKTGASGATLKEGRYVVYSCSHCLAVVVFLLICMLYFSACVSFLFYITLVVYHF